jgi:hypothetical protein
MKESLEICEVVFSGLDRDLVEWAHKKMELETYSETVIRLAIIGATTLALRDAGVAA